MGDDLPYVDLGEGNTAKSLSLGESHTCAILGDDSTRWVIGGGDSVVVRPWTKDIRGRVCGGCKALVVFRGGRNDCSRALVPLLRGVRTYSVYVMPGPPATCRRHSVGLSSRRSDSVANRNLYCKRRHLCGSTRGTIHTVVVDGPTARSRTFSSIFSPTITGKARRTKLHIALFTPSVRGKRAECCSLLQQSYQPPTPLLSSPRCWGKGFAGQLGRGEYYCRGKYIGEMGAGLAAVDLGTNATASFLAAGADFTCAALDDGSVKVCIVPSEHLSVSVLY